MIKRITIVTFFALSILNSSFLLTISMSIFLMFAYNTYYVRDRAILFIEAELEIFPQLPP